MSDRYPPPTRAVDKLVSLAQSTFTGDLSAHEQEGFDRLANTINAHKPRRHLRLLALGLGLAAALLVPLFVAQRHGRTRLSFRITSGASSVASSETSWPTSRIDFSDGSSVVLEASARASVGEVGDHGANVHLDRGKLRTHFVPLPDAHWMVDTGPYRVSSSGGTFDVDWTSSGQIVEIWLREGKMIVQGPLANPGIGMVAGQHLRASGLMGQIVVDQMDPAQASAPAEATELSTPSAQRPAKAPRPAPSREQDL
jgi:ferric-dicitrate binding protein FerR (iron transport regulator)